MGYSSGPLKAKIKILSENEYNKEADQINMNQGQIYTVQLNPNKLQIKDGVNYEKKTGEKAFKNTSGRRIPLGQYTMHEVRELTVELLFDTYTSNLSEKEKKDVKKEYIDKFLKLIANNEGKPPRVFFSWGSIQFMGVITNMGYTYTMFTSEGKPVRAKMDLTIKEYYFD